MHPPQSQNPAPGASADITIESLGGLGDGVAHINAKPLFVAKSCVGDRLRVRITHETHENYTGVITHIIEAGPDRQPAPCPHFAACGGCTLQQLQSQPYRDFKTRMLHAAVTRAGYAPSAADIVFLLPATRRRVEFKPCDIQGEFHLAFYEPRSRNPVPLHTCLILHPALEALMQPLRGALAALPFRHLLRAIALTRADSGIDLLLTLDAPATADQRATLAQLPASLGIARLSLRVKEEAPEVITTLALPTLRLGGIDMPLPPNAFLQATSEGQDMLTEGVLAALPASGAVADLFCGLGTYSLPIAQTRSVHAVESDQTMIRTLKSRAPKHLTTEQRDLFKSPLSSAELSRFAAVVINPPRLGAKAQTQHIAQSKLNTVVMVSCNPATFARDADILRRSGFLLASVQGLDQFVWSPHLEILAIFQR
jgi:23S rRNA (uracil1939-C5)-methyltransferase